MPDEFDLRVSTKHVLESKAYGYIYVKQFSCSCSDFSLLTGYFFPLNILSQRQ